MSKPKIMKNLFLLFLLFTSMVKAQIVNIPDANFKAFLLNTSVTPCAYNQLDNAISVDTNSDGEIQITEAASVYKLVIDNKTMQNLNGIESFTNLTRIEITNNTQLTSVNLTGLSNLVNVKIYGNAVLNSVNFNGLSNLSSLNCTGNQQLTSIDLSPLINVTSLIIWGNGLLNLNIPTPNKFQFIDCSSNPLATIDVSNCQYLTGLDCESCSLLTSIFMKNGRNNSLSCFPTPNLIFICADESEIASLSNIFNFFSQNPNGIVNSYCSFNPGGDYNTITGNVKYDSDNNGCDAADIIPSNIRLNINDGTATGSAFADNSGNYTFYTQAGSFDITPMIENPTWFTFSPTSATIPFADNNNHLTTQNFCITPVGLHQDLEIVLVPIFPARPGFEATYELVLRNKGNQFMNDWTGVRLQYDATKMSFVSSSQVNSSAAAGVLEWGYFLEPFQTQTIQVVFRINTPTDVHPVVIGNLLNFTAVINPIDTDEFPADNTYVFNQTVVGSFDPNNIICLEGDVVPPTEIGNYLHYAINFENTGTYPAENVVVKTEVDASKFDVNSLQLMSANFPVDARITGNKVEFIFKNIQLPIGGHGHILLKMKTKNTLVTGDSVSNRGDIFFDYNAPIDTGLANTVFENLSNSVFETDRSVIITPNPAADFVSVKANAKIKSVEVYDIQGRIINTSIVNEQVAKLHLSQCSSGTYFLKVITEQGTSVQKLIKN